MKLYHFTDPNRLPFIKEMGITRGDVPITMTGGYNAPWFTTDPNPGNQAWGMGGKNGLRITVEIPQGDAKLLKWTDVINKELESLPERDREPRRAWYDVLDKVGGGGQDNWYIYKGVVPFTWVTKTEVLRR